MTIRALTRSDFDAWLPLWQENCQHKIADDVTAETWRRLTNPKEHVHGLGIFDDETLQGFLHYVLHPTTGFIEPTCYMQDLFIAKAYRRQGLATQLVWELGVMGKAQKWARIYWFAQHSDIAVQNLYKNLGIAMDFTLFMYPTQN